METQQKTLALFMCTPYHVANLWHWVEAGISHTLKKSKDNFKAHDVYWYLRDNRATLFLIFLDEELAGFVVVEMTTHPITGVKTLCVWLLYFLGGRDGWSEELQGQLKRLALRVNCSGLEFKSPRRGWEVEAKKHGYVPKVVTWRCELGEMNG